MARRLLLVALVLAGCGASDEPMPPACLESAEAFEQALRAAPAAVRMGDGTPISDCVSGALTTSELQDLGIRVTRAAERLEERAAAGDEEAALQLGYLVGAVQRGADRTTGLQAELAFRVGRAAGSLADPSPALLDALRRGIAAGKASG